MSGIRVCQSLTDNTQAAKSSPPLMWRARAGGSQSEPAVSTLKLERFRQRRIRSSDRIYIGCDR